MKKAFYAISVAALLLSGAAQAEGIKANQKNKNR